MTMDGFKIRRGKNMYLYDPEDFRDDPEGLAFMKVAEKEFYEDVLFRVNNNPRFYLDNLDRLGVFMVRFHHNSNKKTKGL